MNATTQTDSTNPIPQAQQKIHYAINPKKLNFLSKLELALLAIIEIPSIYIYYYTSFFWMLAIPPALIGATIILIFIVTSLEVKHA